MTIYSQVEKNKLRAYVIMGLFVGLLSALFYLLGVFFESPSSYFAVGLIATAGSAGLSYFYADKIVLATVQARPATKENYFDFHTVAENMAIAAGLPMPRLYVIDDPAPNAFATGRDPQHAVICATTGLLDKLERSELEGVIAHELSHIKNYDTRLATIVAVLVGSIALVANWVLRTRGLEGSSRREKKGGGQAVFFVFVILALIIAPLVAKLMQLALSRKRELLADADGALLTRYPEGLAQALEKIAQDRHVLRTATVSTAHLFITNPLKKINLSSQFTTLLSTHPPTEERIRILRSM
jgi:heat shock protein HtpX